jgi:hypothetical protein
VLRIYTTAPTLCALASLDALLGPLYHASRTAHRRQRDLALTQRRGLCMDRVTHRRSSSHAMSSYSVGPFRVAAGHRLCWVQLQRRREGCDGHRART